MCDKAKRALSLKNFFLCEEKKVNCIRGFIHEWLHLARDKRLREVNDVNKHHQLFRPMKSSV